MYKYPVNIKDAHLFDTEETMLLISLGNLIISASFFPHVWIISYLSYFKIKQMEKNNNNQNYFLTLFLTLPSLSKYKTNLISALVLFQSSVPPLSYIYSFFNSLQHGSPLHCQKSVIALTH